MSILGDNIYTTLTGDYIEGKTELDFLSGTALSSIFRKKAKGFAEANSYPPLTLEEEAEVRDFYRGCPPFSMIFHRFYKGITGTFDPSYMPDDLYYAHIEPFMTDRRASRFMDNKCYYPLLFPDVKQPETICSRVGRIWTMKDGVRITPEKVLELIDSEDETVVKASENSQGGHGVTFISGADRKRQFVRAVRGIRGGLTVQRAFRQHEELSALHAGSVNTVRILSMLPGDPSEETRIVSMAVRIGQGDSRVDNLSSGGMMCGINEDGTLTKYAFRLPGVLVTGNPENGIVFEGRKLPGIESAKALVRKIHPRMGKFRLSSWDIAIDRDGEACLIEANFSLGIIMELQAVNGPLFGERTGEVLKEVFGRRYGEK
ncbi:MAG: hypothetical protein K6E33_05145 [Lachnospiraceae bacterium]|nr:hypothetical protein [Lachnospiraceae bacterium]